MILMVMKWIFICNNHMKQDNEIKHIMLVPRQMVSPQGNKPVMGIVQDSLL